MGELTAVQLWTAVLAAASALVLLSNAAKAIANAWQAAKAPNARQDERLSKLERWREEVDGKLAEDYKRFAAIEDGNRITQRALLALLGHGIDGNNLEQMQRAKEELQNHLINR